MGTLATAGVQEAAANALIRAYQYAYGRGLFADVVTEPDPDPVENAVFHLRQLCRRECAAVIQVSYKSDRWQELEPVYAALAAGANFDTVSSQAIDEHTVSLTAEINKRLKERDSKGSTYFVPVHAMLAADYVNLVYRPYRQFAIVAGKAHATLKSVGEILARPLLEQAYQEGLRAEEFYVDISARLASRVVKVPGGAPIKAGTLVSSRGVYMSEQPEVTTIMPVRVICCGLTALQPANPCGNCGTELKRSREILSEAIEPKFANAGLAVRPRGPVDVRSLLPRSRSLRRPVNF